MSLPIGAGTTCRDNGRTCVLHPVGRVDNAQALRTARKPVAPRGPHGFESHSRRQTIRIHINTMTSDISVIKVICMELVQTPKIWNHGVHHQATLSGGKPPAQRLKNRMSASLDTCNIHRLNPTLLPHHRNS